MSLEALSPPTPPAPGQGPVQELQAGAHVGVPTRRTTHHPVSKGDADLRRSEHVWQGKLRKARLSFHQESQDETARKAAG